MSAFHALKAGIVLGLVVATGGIASKSPAASSGEPARSEPARGELRKTESAKTEPCALPEYRSFDFWVGDWDAFEVEKPTVVVARNRVDRILDGCVLLEDYQATDGSHGESFTIYDAQRKLWHQTWVTNHGKLLTFEGGMENGEMVLSGVDRKGDAEETVRGVWKAVNGGVRETAVTSNDGGRTWKPWFDMMFRPAVTGNSSTSDETTVSALDTEYQAAVKRNDAAVMDRILADNFVLVVGSGKTFNKNDLLEEARSGRMHYERQEDSEQKVRVWGDTAVVTANLWEKGTNDGKPFDVIAWFSDTYIRTPAGWRYAFAQSSLPLPKANQ